MTRRSRKTQYSVQLGRRYIERVECNNESSGLCTLYRFERPVFQFFATRSQLRKILDGSGRINIAAEQVEKGRR